MNKNELKKLKDKIEKRQIDKSQQRLLIKMYKEGLSLFELTNLFKLDFFSVISILKKSKIKKEKLYQVFDKQIIRSEMLTIKRSLTDREQHDIKKYFPEVNEDITFSFFVHWSKKYKKSQTEKEECQHYVKHIRCAKCGKILGDATNLELNSPVLSYNE
ncbi:MAG: hypothetical protein WC346_07830 [Methanogenium sp.]